MKKLFSTLFIIMVLSLSTTVFADNSVTLINKGEQVDLVNPIIERNGDYYISADDLNSINIDYVEYEENVYGLGQMYGYMKYTFYLDSGILEYENTYENAVFVENDIIYVSLGALIDIYSYSFVTEIDTENDILSVWINNYTTSTHWVTYEIDSSIPITEDGLEVELYRGFKRNMSYAGAYDMPVPELFEGIDTTYIPEKTDVYNIGNSHSITSSETHTFYDDTRSYEIWFDVTVRGGVSGGGSYPLPASSSSSSGGTVSGGGTSSGGGGSGSSVNGYSTAGIKIDTDEYVGGIYQRTTAARNKVILTIDDCMDFISVSGTITVPEQSEDLGYIVVAEANNSSYLTDYGTYHTRRDFATYQAGVIPANETTSTYKLKLEPNMESYVVYIITGGKYIRQYEIYDDLAEDKILNFDNFEVSKEITGRIQLPDGITSFTDCYGDTLSSISGYVTLQGATAPYYIVKKAEVEIDASVGYADFVLKDDLGVNNGYVSFDIGGGGIREVYKAGVYYDNDKTVYIAEDGKSIPTDTKDIVLNIAKGKPFIIDVNHEVNSNVSLTINILKDDENIPADKNFIWYLQDLEIDYTGNDPIFDHVTKHLVVVPEDTDRYVLELKDHDNPTVPLYLNENKVWVFDLESPTIFTTAMINDGEGTVHKGYDPPTPIKVEYIGTDSENGEVYGYNVESPFTYEATIYVGYYGEGGKLLHLESRPYTFEDYMYYELYFDLNPNYEPLAEKIKMFIWTDNLRPLSTVTSMKPTEW